MKDEITVVEIITAVKGKKQELRKALADIVPISRAAHGCLQYDLLEPIGESGEFLILMRWEKLADLRRHETSEYISEFVRKYDQVLYADAVVTEWKRSVV